MFQVNDKVITTGFAYYEKNVPIGEKGIIVKIRHRYSSTHHEYNQYKVVFDNDKYKTDLNNLDNLFDQNHIELID
jgi:hypothetical protein